MKEYTERVFGLPWEKMEEQWSCSSLLQQCSKTPIFRIISESDPIVPFHTINKSKLKNLAKFCVQHGAGHCNAFAHQPSLSSEIRKFYFEALAGAYA